ncbi:MAG: hypothetical protein Q9157_003045 [Trypethelium eluteriae]
MAPPLGTKRVAEKMPTGDGKRRRIAHADPKRTSVVKQLGRGVTGAVYHVKHDIAIKEFKDDPSIDKNFKAFKVEKDAFEILQDIEGLRGRIPAYFGEQISITTNTKGDSNYKALGLEFVEGETLFNRQRRYGLRYGELGRIWEALKMTLEILHEAGVTHADTHSNNVMIRCSVSDSARPIEERDRELVERVQAGGDIEWFLSPYMENPLREVPSLQVALAILKNLQKRNKYQIAFKFSKTYKPVKRSLDDPTYFEYRNLEACTTFGVSAAHSLKLYRRLITESIETLGLTHSQSMDAGLCVSLTLAGNGRIDAAVRVAYYFLRVTFPLQQQSNLIVCGPTKYRFKFIRIIRENVTAMKDTVVKNRMEDILRKFEAKDLRPVMGFRDYNEANILLFDQIWGI